LTQKNQKVKSAKRLLCRTGLRCKSGKTWAGKVCPAIAPLIAIASAKIPYALPALLATIVLPDFGRSFFADGLKNVIESSVIWSLVLLIHKRGRLCCCRFKRGRLNRRGGR